MREKLRIYFRSDNISLETSLYWVSEDVVRFKIEVRVVEKCTKNVNTISDEFFPHTPVYIQQRIAKYVVCFHITLCMLLHYIVKLEMFIL